MRSFRIAYLLAFPSFVMFLAALACGSGETGGERHPGGTTGLDPDPTYDHSIGGIAVQPDLHNAWVVHRDVQHGNALTWLAAIDLSSLHPTDVFDVSSVTNLQILFPHAGRGLLFGRALSGEQELVQLDTDTLQTGLSLSETGDIVDARSSPSGKFVAVQDGAYGPGMQIELIDSETLEHSIVSAPGFLQATWDHSSDHLIGIAENEDNGYEAHLMRWPISSATSIPVPDFDVVLPGFMNDCYFSFNWIAISPDDRWAVFPLTEKPAAIRTLVIVDQLDGSVRMVHGSGPVGFTPDSSTIVSYEGSALLLIDVATLAMTSVPTPNVGSLQYFTSHGGNQVVVTSTSPGDYLLLYDIATNTTVDLQVHVSLDEFVWRESANEIWSASDDMLWRITLDTASALVVNSGYSVRHLNIVPPNLLLLAPPSGGTLHLFDTETQTNIGSVTLTAPAAP